MVNSPLRYRDQYMDMVWARPYSYGKSVFGCHHHVLGFLYVKRACYPSFSLFTADSALVVGNKQLSPPIRKEAKYASSHAYVQDETGVSRVSVPIFPDGFLLSRGTVSPYAYLSTKYIKSP